MLKTTLNGEPPNQKGLSGSSPPLRAPATEENTVHLLATALASIAISGTCLILQFPEAAIVAALLGATTLILLSPGVVFAFYVPAAFVIVYSFSFSEIAIAPETLFLFLFLPFALLRALVDGRLQQLTHDVLPLLLACGLFILAGGVSTLFSTANPGALKFFLQAPLFAVNAVLPTLALGSGRQMTLTLRMIAIAAMLLSTASLLANFMDLPAILTGYTLLGFRNPLGHFLSIGFLSMATLWIYETSSRNRYAAMGLLVLAALLLLGSRASWLSLILGFAFLVPPALRSSLSMRRYRRLRHSILATTLLLIFVLGPISGDFILDRMGSFFQFADRGSSNIYRIEILQLAFRLFLDSPIVGQGVGSFEKAGAGFADDLRSLRRRIVGADNDVARVLGEMGIVGVVAVITILFVLLRRAIRSARDPGSVPAASSFGRSLLAAVSLLLLFEGLLYTPLGWLLLGLSWAAQRGPDA